MDIGKSKHFQNLIFFFFSFQILSLKKLFFEVEF